MEFRDIKVINKLLIANKLKISIIAAISQNMVLGHNNKLLWHLPNDLKRFKKKTKNNIVIMGRKTFESLKKPLIKRHNIILTNNKKLLNNHNIEVSNNKNIEISNSLTSIILENQDKQMFIIGGGEIYKLAMKLKLVNKIELTLVHGKFTGDTKFPEINLKEWKKIYEKKNNKDYQHMYNYTYKTYVLK